MFCVDLGRGDETIPPLPPPKYYLKQLKKNNDNENEKGFCF
jgi:hypothetical protein